MIIHNTAIINKGKIVNGPSFQLRNNINVDCMNNSVISSGTPRFKKITGKIASFLTGAEVTPIIGIGCMTYYLDEIIEKISF